jgi:hypothetical protein
MTAGRASLSRLGVLRSPSVAVVSRMREKTWQLNYKSRSKKSCVTILRKVRGELRERLSTVFWGRIISFVFPFTWIADPK